MPTTDFMGELRYSLINEDFRHLFKDVYLIHSRIVSMLTYKWMFFENVLLRMSEDGWNLCTEKEQIKS